MWFMTFGVAPHVLSGEWQVMQGATISPLFMVSMNGRWKVVFEMWQLSQVSDDGM